MTIKMYSYKGRTQCLKFWVDELSSVPYETVRSRLKANWDFEKALMIKADQAPRKRLRSRKFEHLKVVSKLPDEMWKCLCDCGKTIEVYEDTLIAETMKSCGECDISKDSSQKERLINMYYNREESLAGYLSYLSENGIENITIKDLQKKLMQIEDKYPVFKIIRGIL